jgi:hypothetical protein
VKVKGKKQKTNLHYKSYKHVLSTFAPNKYTNEHEQRTRHC